MGYSMKIGIVPSAYFGWEEDIDGLKRMKKHGYDCMDYDHLSDTNKCKFYHCDNEEFLKIIEQK